jgi:hypothetical protein
MLVTSATFFNFHSKDFLLPYSSLHPIHPIAAHNHPLGDIKSTDTVNIIPSNINITVNAVFIQNRKKIKRLPNNIIIISLNSR